MWFLSTRIGRALSAITGALLAFLGVYAMGRREGAKNERQEAKEHDQKRADTVRERVDNVERVQPENITFRD